MHTAEPLATPGSRLALYEATLRRRWRLAVAIVAVAVVAGALVGALTPKSYEATAKVLIGQRAQLDALLGASNYEPDPERELNTNLALISLEPVAADVRRTLGLRTDTGTLLAKLSTAVDRNSRVVSITVRDASPREAARIANAFASGFRDFAARSSQASLAEALTAAREEAAELPPGPDRDALDAEVRRLQAVGAFRTSGVQVVREATAASAAPTGSVAVTGVLAGFLGLLVAACTIVVLARRDRRVHDEGELEAALETPVLATVPLSVEPRSETAGRDAFADLALTLGLVGMPAAAANNGRAASIVLVTSPGPDEGVAAVTLGLTRALGEMGRRAIAIEADLRGPRFAAELGLEQTAGLAGILAEGRRLDDELLELPLGIGAGVPGGAVATGARKPLPQALLAGPRMAALLADARSRADVVFVAGAPTTQSADSLALAPWVDAVLIVARLGQSREDDLQRARQAFEQLDVHVAGAVATAERPGRRGGQPARRPPGRPRATVPDRTGAPSNGSPHDQPEVIAP